MEAKSDRQDIDSDSASVFQICGEPAIRINGVPDLPPNVRCPDQFAITSDREEAEEPGLGEWLEGRTVRKLFGDEYYSGKVVKFDREMKWYRVVYEDGDFEDLEWHELKNVLQPLDISVPFNKLIPKYSKNSKPLLESAGRTVRPRKSNTSSVKKAAGQRSCGSKKKLNIKGNFKPAKVSENLEETEGQIGQNVESRKRGRPKKVDKVSLEPNEHHLSDLEKTTDLIRHTERVISEGSSYETIEIGRSSEVDKKIIESSRFHPSKIENDEQTAAKLTCITQASKSEECNLLNPVKYHDDDADGASLETASLVIESIISSITQTKNEDKSETPDS